MPSRRDLLSQLIVQGDEVRPTYGLRWGVASRWHVRCPCKNRDWRPDTMLWLEWAARYHLVDVFTVVDGPVVRDGETVILVRCRLAGSHRDCPRVMYERLGQAPKPLRDISGTAVVDPSDPALR